MKAANTAGTLMKRKNWSTESIAVSPKTTCKDKLGPPRYSTPCATC